MVLQSPNTAGHMWKVHHSDAPAVSTFAESTTRMYVWYVLFCFVIYVILGIKSC